MIHRTWIGAATVAAVLCLSIAGAIAEDVKGDARYPNWEGLWKRGSPVGVWDPTKPPGLGQQPPLTPEELSPIFGDGLIGQAAAVAG
jgi:hypothetical protein